MSKPAKARLATEILAAYVATRWYLRQATLPGVVTRLRQVTSSGLDLPLRGDQAPRLGRAVSRTLGRLPADSRCLVRSLVLVRLLARRGVSSELVIAACPEASEGFAAHAWVEVGGRPVLPPAGPPYGRLLTL
jgi:hypothetical protein